MLNIFNSRKRNNTAFQSEYDSYWSQRCEDEGVSTAMKRRVESMIQVNEDICEEVEAISKRSKLNTFKTINESVHSINKEIEDEAVLDIDNKGVHEIVKDQMEQNELDELIKITNLMPYTISTYCNLLIEKIKNCTPSSIRLRKVVRTSVLLEEELFDFISYQDLNFVEVTVTHFLNLIDSPNNPLLQKNLERTIAVQTTIIILNNLFIANNDIIDINWMEKTTELTGSSKWDGVGFSMKNRKLIPLLIEFSGGIRSNCTMIKKATDENKLIKGMKTILEYTQATITDDLPIPEYYVRFYSKFIHDDGLLSPKDNI